MTKGFFVRSGENFAGCILPSAGQTNLRQGEVAEECGEEVWR